MKKQSRRNSPQTLKPKWLWKPSGTSMRWLKLAVKYDINPVMISKWKGELLENIAAAPEKKDGTGKAIRRHAGTLCTDRPVRRSRMSA